MRKRDVKRDASGPSMFLSTVALMLSMLATVAYFVFKSDNESQPTENVSVNDNVCPGGADKEAVYERLSVLKEQSSDEWPARCQEQLNNALYETAILKATEGRFNTAFGRLCQIPESPESEYFEEAQFLFSVWEDNRNSSGESQEIKPLLQSFFEDYDNPNENCPAARAVLEELN